MDTDRLIELHKKGLLLKTITGGSKYVDKLDKVDKEIGVAIFDRRNNWMKEVKKEFESSGYLSYLIENPTAFSFDNNGDDTHCHRIEVLYEEIKKSLKEKDKLIARE